MDSSSSFDLASATGPESEEQTPSVALQEPVQPTSLGFQILYGLANTVIGLGNITFFTLLLPASIAQVAHIIRRIPLSSFQPWGRARLSSPILWSARSLIARPPRLGVACPGYSLVCWC